MNKERMKLYGKRALCIILFLAGIALIYKLLEYPLDDDTTAQTRVTFHDYYETDPIDILFIGPSHTVYFLDAVKMTDDLGVSVFNIGSKDQLLVASDYIIRDAVMNRGVKRVFCEMSVSRLIRKVNGTIPVYIVSDYFRNFVYKMRLWFGETHTDEYMDGFRIRRNIEPLEFDLSQPLKTMEKKKDPDYINYKGTEKYRGRGQWAQEGVTYRSDGYAFNINTNQINHAELEDVQAKQLNYLLDIIHVCQENDVELVFYVPPYDEVYKQCFENYWEITAMARDLIEGEGATMIDMNLVKDEYLNLNVSDFYSHDHASTTAGERITVFLEQYIQNPDGDYFHSTIEEKHPDQDSVTAVAFSAEFITDKGTYSRSDKIKGNLQEVKVQVWAQGYHEIPATARMWNANYDKKTKEFIEDEELVGTKIDEFKTEFSFPGEAFGRGYVIKLYDPVTGEEIYRAPTKFNKD